jgi:phage-related protein/DNA-binding Xre family transcriptional regulator
MYQYWYTESVAGEPKLRVRFYQEDSGSEPVREWLKGLPVEERKSIGADIKTVQFRWPVGLPWVRSLGGGLWEVRSNLGNRTARVIFAIESGEMFLLHGFIKKRRGSDFDDFLREQGLLEEVEALAAKRLIAHELAQIMAREKLSKAALAKRMGTSRSQVDRLLDPDNESVTLVTLAKAAAAVGQRLRVSLSPQRAA